MNKEFKIGLVAIFSIIVLIFGINYLKGLNMFNSSKYFFAKYENIGGLKVGSFVLVNGFQVGSVSNIELLTNDNQNLLVTVNINYDISIPINTICKIVNQDLMGTKGINLILGNDTVLANIGDTLISGIESSLQDEVNAQILPLKIKTEDLIGSVDSVMMIITAILNKDTRENLKNSFASLDTTFELMSHTMIQINQVVDHNDERISNIVKNIESNNHNITKILENFSNISEGIAKSNINNLLNSLDHISNKINKSEGSLGMLIHDEDLYINLKNSSKELENLINDIKENPKRYVRFSILGGKSKSHDKKD
tara:strand:+ start:11621 stop:12553 length:933 start_codon:yes stop_codon:yes gene_type:complete